MFDRFFKKKESLVSIDIGSSWAKLLEVDCSSAKPKILRYASVPVSFEAGSLQGGLKSEQISRAVSLLLEKTGNLDMRCATCIASPSVFTKRLTVPKMSIDELDQNIKLEAANFIPHSIDAVNLDFHVLREVGKSQLEVLVVAVKAEVVDSMIEGFGVAGLDLALIDVDYFAVQNSFESRLPEFIDKTVAIINIGHRYSCISICSGGNSLFTGDIALGGKSFTDSLSDKLSVSSLEAEKLKSACYFDETGGPESARIILSSQTETVATELNRQVSLLWNASGEDGGIDQILLVGGGAQVLGLTAQVADRTGVNCAFFDPLAGVEIADDVNRLELEKSKMQLAVAFGVGLRSPGDRIVPEFMR